MTPVRSSDAGTDRLRRHREPALADPWPAPYAERPVDAVVEVPGSKSATARAAVLAALSAGPSTIHHPLVARDTQLMATGVTRLGADLTQGADQWTVSGRAGSLRARGRAIEVGNAGTVARFLPAMAALTEQAVHFDGDPRVRERPMAALLAALGELGVDIDDGGRGTLPFTVRGHGRIVGGSVDVDASASSQIVSGLLMAAPCFETGLTVRHVGPRLPSSPHVAMTVELLRVFGATIDDSEPNRWRVEPSGLAGRSLEVEPDLSGAAPFLAAAVVTGGIVRVPRWPPRSAQPGARLPALLEQMGGAPAYDEATSTMTVRGGDSVHGLTADLGDCGELAPVLAALAALADGPSTLTGIAHLRRQESDRLAALSSEIGRLGGDVRVIGDGLTVQPRPLHGAVFGTYDDHRLAMAAAVLGLAVPDVAIENVATTQKTMPHFPRRWMAMVGRE
jgi:3-phosphoshikimate 1-carboxyvinyltransferase